MITTVRLNQKLIKTLSDVILVPSAKIMKDADIPNSTWYYIMDHPEGISIQQLLQLANGMHIPARRFFSFGKADLIGRREDYIAEPYIECRYDDEALQDLVNARPSATWQKAAKTIGMSRSRLRDSLLAITRTPVVRFLKVCEAFGIDPFSILVDPNPDQKQKKRPAKEDETVRNEIRELTKKIDDLNSTVDELTRKFTALLDRHNQLEEEVRDYLGFGRPLMAADDGAEDR